MTERVLICLQSWILLLSGCTQRPMGGGRGWDHMMGYGLFGGIFMWLILLIIAAIIVYLVLSRSKSGRTFQGSARENPADILKARYAKGEITKEEFDRLKKDIEQ